MVSITMPQSITATRRYCIPVIKRSAHVWNPSQQMTKGVSGAKFFTLKGEKSLEERRSEERTSLLVDDARANTRVNAKDETKGAEQYNHSHNGSALRELVHTTRKSMSVRRIFYIEAKNKNIPMGQEKLGDDGGHRGCNCSEGNRPADNCT